VFVELTCMRQTRTTEHGAVADLGEGDGGQQRGCIEALKRGSTGEGTGGGRGRWLTWGEGDGGLCASAPGDERLRQGLVLRLAQVLVHGVGWPRGGRQGHGSAGSR
jgi:hypothetical protein